MSKSVIRAKGADRAEILVYDDIGAGMFGGMTAKDFADELKALGPVREINVRIQSGGGNVFDGVAMYNSLKRHPARIVVDVDGLAASIASLIAMAGDQINMAEDAIMMIHNPWTVTGGGSKELRKAADTLDKVADNLVNAYHARTGMHPDNIRSFMEEETWMTAEEAREFGFADRITEPMQMAASADLSRYQYQHVPRSLQARAPARARNQKVVRMNLRARRHKV